jgi:hypothetical protein
MVAQWRNSGITTPVNFEWLVSGGSNNKAVVSCWPSASLPHFDRKHSVGSDRFQAINCVYSMDQLGFI